MAAAAKWVVHREFSEATVSHMPGNLPGYNCH